MLTLPEYTIRENTIQHMSAEKLLNALPSNSVDMILTSPPYDNLRNYNGYSFNFKTISAQSYRVLKQGGVLVWVVGDAVTNGSETLTSMRQALHFVDVCGFRMHDTMIYQKDGTPFPDVLRYNNVFEYMFVLSKGKPKTVNLQKTLTRGYSHAPGATRQKDGQMKNRIYETGKPIKPYDNIWNIQRGNGKTTKDIYAYKHPAMFPEELAIRHILTWSNPNDIVLDYFIGAGTTSKMAHITERRYIGCDISREYVDIARRRVADSDPFQPKQVSDDLQQLSLFDSIK